MRGLMRRGLAKIRFFVRRATAWSRLPIRAKQMFLIALILNPMFRLVVKRKGIKSAVALALRLGGTKSVSDSPTHLPVARQVVLGVRAAAGALPIEVVCLPRALSAWTLLHRRGIGSELLIGWDSEVKKRTAHAWVVVAGEAVGEVAEHIAQLAAFNEPILAAQ
jgi:Transglutaminase-like superfamily